MTQNIRKIYLHWSATHYTWAKPGHYHTIILGNGTVKRMTGYEQPLGGHTFARNANAVAICLACMGGRGWADFPPTAAQIESMCKEVALLAYRLKWQPKDITIKRVLTHAEAAANRDYPMDIARRVSGWTLPSSTPQQNQYAQLARRWGLPHENYGPSRWFDNWPGGFVERWDLWQLKASDPQGQGGFTLRSRIQQLLKDQYEKVEIDFSPQAPKPLRTCDIFREQKLISKGFLLPDQRCYVRLSDLTRAYGLRLTWNSNSNYANLLAPNLQGKFLANAPLIMGYPAIDIYLNRPEDEDGEPIADPDLPVRPIMQGILINNASHVLIAEFAQELGIALKVSPNMAVYLGPLPVQPLEPPDGPPPEPLPGSEQATNRPGSSSGRNPGTR